LVKHIVDVKILQVYLWKDGVIKEVDGESWKKPMMSFWGSRWCILVKVIRTLVKGDVDLVKDGDGYCTNWTRMMTSTEDFMRVRFPFKMLCNYSSFSFFFIKF